MVGDIHAAGDGVNGKGVEVVVTVGRGVQIGTDVPVARTGETFVGDDVFTNGVPPQHPLTTTSKSEPQMHAWRRWHVFMMYFFTSLFYIGE